MDEIVLNQLELVRSWTIKVAESVSEESVKVRLKGFNNNIHWHIGHILASTEYFLFDLPYDLTHLPANYIERFNTGTGPDDWEGNVPTVDDLVSQLKEQRGRIEKISAAELNKVLIKPRHGFETLGDCAGFSVVHEALHVGKIEEIERAIRNLV